MQHMLGKLDASVPSLKTGGESEEDYNLRLLSALVTALGKLKRRGEGRAAERPDSGDYPGRATDAIVAYRKGDTTFSLEDIVNMAEEDRALARQRAADPTPSPSSPEGLAAAERALGRYMR
jgi:hypothetical protein